MIAIIFFGLNTSSAQTKLVLNGGVQFPTGDLKTVVPGADTKMGFGGTVEGEFTVSNSPTSSIAVTVLAGYNRFTFDTPATFTGDASLGIGTFMGGIKAFFDQFYIGGSAGLASPSFKITGLTINADSEFMWSGTVGVRVDRFDINARYQSFSSNGSSFPWFGINAGYMFDL